MADVNGGLSNTGTVNVFVGSAVASKGTAAHSITFTDRDGGAETLSINSGIANVYFSGSGTLAVAKNGKAIITGPSSLEIADIQLNNTPRSSTLSIKGATAHPVTIGGISDSSAIGTLSAASATLSGPLTFPGGLGTIKAASISDAQISVGAGSTGKLALSAGAVTNSSLTSAVPITALKISSWTDASPETITAPSIASLSVTGSFNPGLTLSGKSVDLSSARIGGAVNGGTWAIAGSVGAINLTSAASGWTPTIAGALNALSIKSGGLASALSAASIGTIYIGGDLTAGISTTSAKSIKITGGASGAAITVTGTAGLKTLSIGGAVTNETITSVGNIGTVTAGSISGSTLTSGVASGVTVATATTSTLGTGVISSLKLTSKAAGAFANTSVLASRINSAALVSVTTSNSGTSFGVITKAINSFSATFANGPVRLSAAQLKSETILQLYLKQQAIVFNDFTLVIEI